MEPSGRNLPFYRLLQFAIIQTFTIIWLNFAASFNRYSLHSNKRILGGKNHGKMGKKGENHGKMSANKIDHHVYTKKT